MKGHIRERGAGHWYAVIDRPDSATGKRRQKWQKLKARGKREAQIECAQLISQVADGIYIDLKKDHAAAIPGKLARFQKA